MQGMTDSNIWEYAKTENYIIVSSLKIMTFDNGLFFLVFRHKVIWLSVGNGRTKVLANLILKNSKQIITFANNSTEGLFVLNQT